MTANKMVRGVALAVGAMGFACAAHANTWYVSTSGDDGTGDGSWDAPFRSITNAVAKAIAANDKTALISVQPGTYVGGIKNASNNFCANIRAQIGDVDNPDPSQTIIECAGKTGGAYLMGANSAISGFTIQNGIWGWEGDNGLLGSGVALANGAKGSNLVVRCCITTPDSRTPSGKGYSLAVVHVIGSGSEIADSFIYNCTNETTAASKSSEIYGGGLCLKDFAAARRCVVSNCWTIAGKDGGNHRGGGVYLTGANAVLDSCQILDCGTDASYAANGTCEGGGICTVSTGTVTNCLVSGCSAKGSGGGIRAAHGWTLIVDTTITNCWVTGGSGGGFHTSGNAPAISLGMMRRCRIVDCSRSLPFYQAMGIVEDCVIENNQYANGVVQVAGTSTIFRNNVVRNNTSTGGPALSYCATGCGTSVVEKCWFTGNTCGNGYGVIHRGKAYSLHFLVDGCVITGNTCGYGIYSSDNSSFKLDSKEIAYLPVSERHPSTRVRNCTVANNTLSQAGIYFTHDTGDLGGPQYLSVTNCLVAANGASIQAFKFQDTVKAYFDEHLGRVAYCAMEEGLGNNLPADPEGVAHNQIGKVGVKAGTTTPTGLARDNGYLFDGMQGAQDIGDGTYEVGKSADWGVAITAKNVHDRVVGKGVDIGASEYKPASMLLIVR